MRACKLAVVGAGWAGLAAAIEATRAGHRVTLFEASRVLGGRARTIESEPKSKSGLVPAGDLDNGQHILIGAYRQSLSLMASVGVAPERVLHAMPLNLRNAQGEGIALPAWPAPWDAAWGIATARGWTWVERLALARAALAWRRSRFECAAHETVASLCTGLPARVMAQWIEPLCVSALNTLAHQASGQVFLRVLRDSLLGPGWGRWGASWLLLPRVPLGQLLPEAAGAWLGAQGAHVRTGHRVLQLARSGSGWQVDGEAFDAVVLACPSWDAIRLITANAIDAAQWLACAHRLQHEAIATVYAHSAQRLACPMVALRSGPEAPAQFVFDRGQLGGPPGLLAFVASAPPHALTRESLENQVMAQAHALGWQEVQALQTVVEKRATFACTPGGVRPDMQVGPGLWACGDWVKGPYPATLEGAVISGQQVVQALI